MRGRLVQIACLLPLFLAAVSLAEADNQYTIKEGETLFSISRQAQVPVNVLSDYNGISDATKVRIGTVVKVPAVHVVKKGDTLYGIARTFGVPIDRIFELNKLTSSSRIRIGERIYVPREADRPPTPAAQDAQGTDRAPAVRAAAMQRSPGSAVVWPHAGRHEPDNGKIPGLVFYGTPGDIVRSATAGEVKWAATYWTRGKVVIIKAPDGTLFTYGGNAELLVNVGDRVSAGMDIAKLGESPQGGGAKLYFSISDGTGHALNPERFFSEKSDS